MVDWPRVEVTDAPPFERQPVQYPSCPHVTDFKPKCWRCKRVFGAYLTRPWELKCQRCNALTSSPVVK